MWVRVKVNSLDAEMIDRVGGTQGLPGLEGKILQTGNNCECKCDRELERSQVRKANLMSPIFHKNTRNQTWKMPCSHWLVVAVYSSFWRTCFMTTQVSYSCTFSLRSSISPCLVITTQWDCGQSNTIIQLDSLLWKTACCYRNVLCWAKYMEGEWCGVKRFIQVGKLHNSLPGENFLTGRIWLNFSFLRQGKHSFWRSQET